MPCGGVTGRRVVGAGERDVEEAPLLSVTTDVDNWTMYSSFLPRTPGQRAGLTHDAVIAAARAVLDRGADGLSNCAWTS